MEHGAREAWAEACRLICEDGMSDYLERDMCVSYRPCTVMQPQSHRSGDPPQGEGLVKRGTRRVQESQRRAPGPPHLGPCAVQDRTSCVLSSGWSEMRANSSLGALKHLCAREGPQSEGRATPRPHQGSSSTWRPGSPVGSCLWPFTPGMNWPLRAV